MDSVPFAFCDSVCSLFPYRISYLSGSSANWKSADRRNVKNRVYVDVHIFVRGNEWSYRFKNLNRSQEMSFEELKKVNRRYLHVQYVDLAEGYFTGTRSSLEEIMEIVQFTAPCVNTKFSITGVNDDDFRQFAEILPFYKHVSFSALCLFKIADFMTEFINYQLESGMVRSLKTMYHDKCGCRRVLEAFPLTKQCEFAQLHCPRTPFDMAYFEQLLVKPYAGHTSRINVFFTFELDALRTVKPDQRVDHKNSKIVWKREDGVVVDCLMMSDDQKQGNAAFYTIGISKPSI